MGEFNTFGEYSLEDTILTSVGRIREHNEDFAHVEVPEQDAVRKNMGILAIVADGMGGHAAGEVAAQVAIETIVRVYYEFPFTMPTQKALSIAFQEANKKVLEIAEKDSSKKGMGTTISLALFKGDKAYIQNVGDSRTALFRLGIYKQVTVDHSYVQELGLTEQQARSSPFKNRITRAVGYQEEMEIDSFEEELMENDVFLLYTDGIVNHLFPEEIAEILREESSLSRCAERLIASANERGGTDNSTVILTRVTIQKEKERKEMEGPQEEKRVQVEDKAVIKEKEAESKEDQLSASNLPPVPEKQKLLTPTNTILLVIAAAALVFFLIVLSDFFQTPGAKKPGARVDGDRPADKTEVKKEDTKKEEATTEPKKEEANTEEKKEGRE